MSDYKLAPKSGYMTKKSVESLKEEDLKGKRVLVRADLDVPLDYQYKITDDTRIHAALPTIKYLMQHGARVILASRLGCPGGWQLNYSMSRLVPKLSELLGVKVKMAKNCVGNEVEELARGLHEGEVLLLENLFFFEQEEVNGDLDFANKLASLADLFVNDCFVTSHKLHASTQKVTSFLRPAVAGFLMRKELECLTRVVEYPKRPFAAIVGGGRLSTKADLIKSLLNKVDLLLLGGATIFNFYAAQGKSVGSSIVDYNPDPEGEDYLEVKIANSIIEMAKEKGVKLLLPQDVVVADIFGPDANRKVVKSSEIPDDWMGLDIGTDTVTSFCGALDSARTIIWTGPMGAYEYDRFAHGTKAIVEKLTELTEKGVETIIVGGATVAVRKAGVADKMSFISTGRCASSLLLQGKELPAVSSLDDEYNA